MADVAQVSSAESPTTSKKKDKVARPKTNHPTTAIMVNGAIQNLKERGGSSLQAIKKYIAVTYKINAEKFSPFIRKYIKNAVEAGVLIQTKGKGASGSFKLASAAVTKSVKAPTKPKKTAGRPGRKPAAKSNENLAAEKVSVKKTTKAKKSPAKKTAVKEAKPKSPSKAKKTAKAPTKKPKSPKPKTTKGRVGKSPKKAQKKK